MVPIVLIQRVLLNVILAYLGQGTQTNLSTSDSVLDSHLPRSILSYNHTVEIADFPLIDAFASLHWIIHALLFFILSTATIFFCNSSEQERAELTGFLRSIAA